MKLGSLGFSATVAAALLVKAAQAETVKVGLILPFSGGSAEFGEQIERGIRLYLKTYPEALGGHQVEFIRRDSKRPGGDVAKTATQELVLRENVKILAGYETSPDAIATAPIATSAKVPMLVLNAATAWITNLSPYIVRVGRTMWQSSYPLGTYAYGKLECRTAAVGYTDYPPGKDSLEAAASPLLMAAPRVPVLVAHGEREPAGFPAQSAAFHAYCAAAAPILVAGGADHFSILDALRRGDTPLASAMRAQIQAAR